MKTPKKLKLKQKFISKEKMIQIYNLDDENVQRLNIDDYNINNLNSKNIDKEININIKSNIERKMSEKFLNKLNKKEKKGISDLNISSTNNTYILNDLSEDSFPLNKLSSSINKLKTLIPSINKKITNDNSVKIFSTPRLYNMNYEKYLNNILRDLNKKENELKNNKKNLENELKNIEDEIYDKKLNIELMRNEIFQKNVKEKIIQKYEEEFKENQDQEILNNIKNQTKEIDKETLFAVINKNKDVYDLKEQQIKEAQKLMSKQDLKAVLKEKAFKSKLNNIILGNQLLSKRKSEQFISDIKSKKDRKKIICKDLNYYHEKLENLHYLQKKIKNKLYTHYLSILKEGSDTREEGLAWIISEILNLGKKVLMSYMPTYLDEKCVLYLFLKAHIILKIKYIEKKLNEFREIFRKKGLIQKQGKREMQNLKAMNALNFIKQKFFNNNSETTNEKTTNFENEKNQINSTSTSQNKNSILFTKENKKRLQRASSVFFKINHNNYFNSNEESNEIMNNIKLKDIKKYLSRKNNKMHFEEYFELNKEIEKLKKLKEILKEEEMKRIFEEFHRNKYLQRYKVEKDVVLSALIGEENISNETFIQNKKEKELNEEIFRTRLFRKNEHVKDVMMINNNSGLIKENNSFRKENENIKSIYNIKMDYINNK